VLASSTGVATKVKCCHGGPIHYAVFFCTDKGFGIEMVQALDEPHSVDIVHALQPDAVTEGVPAAFLDGKDKMKLLWQWMDDLDEFRATGEWPASLIPPAHAPAAACSEHDHSSG
jgi:hypothetical protein